VSHGGEGVNVGLLGWNAVWTCRRQASPHEVTAQKTNMDKLKFSLF
jgi:hypothetical protein